VRALPLNAYHTLVPLDRPFDFFVDLGARQYNEPSARLAAELTTSAENAGLLPSRVGCAPQKVGEFHK